MTRSHATTPRKPLRLWPGVAAVALLWLARFGIKAVVPGFEGFSRGMMWGFAGVAGVLLWWAFFSRAPRTERWLAPLAMVLALAATYWLNHISMGPLWLVGYAVPVLLLAFVAWAVATRRLPDGQRRLTMVATIAIASLGWTLVKTGGINGDHAADFSWRWTVSAEERLLASSAGDAALAPPPAAAAAPRPAEPIAAPPEPAAAPVPEARDERTESAAAPPSSIPAAVAHGASWPSFRGADRDGIVRGIRIATDWSQTPPVEVWRRPIGPGWSSFAVSGGLLYTQEQRGEEEIVSCYRADTGQPVWMHRDAARFFESNAGAGPRATPTLSGGRVYTFGATGILNVLDAASGAVVWSRNVSSDTGVGIPIWGFSSSPLVVNDTVIVAAAGQLVAYHRTTGERQWAGPNRGGSYSSPHLANVGGTPHVLLMFDGGVTSLSPADGAVLWQHEWPGSSMVQPALAGEDVLISHLDTGTRRLAVAHGSSGWTAEERWTTNALKPYFNDFVVHKGHAYGFDGRILAAVDLADGKRKWKGGRYGNGQLVLLPDQDLLLVLSEEGDLALVNATPDAFKELAQASALNGKTWNHPVLIDDLLFVRNGEEMVAFRLALAR